MSKISVTTIAGLTSGGDANTVKIESGDDFVVDTSVLKVDASNNRVGVGTASPTSDLHVSGGAGAHVAIQSSAGSHWRLGDAVGSSNGIFVVRDHTNSANRIQILADGKTQIAQGITFGSDTAAANTLDDYEEGTFTPASGEGSLSGVSGYYTKIGNVVRIGMKFSMPSSSSGASATISGLPFTCFNDNAARAGIVVSWNSNSQGNAGLDFLIGENSTAGTFYIDGASRTYANLSSDTIYLGGTYITNT